MAPHVGSQFAARSSKQAAFAALERAIVEMLLLNMHLLGRLFLLVPGLHYVTIPLTLIVDDRVKVFSHISHI